MTPTVVPVSVLNTKVRDREWLAPHLSRPNLADGLSRQELAALLEELKALEGRVIARLLLNAPEQPAATTPQADDRMLTADEAAAILRRKPSWIYRNASRLPFIAKRTSPRSKLLC